MTEKFDVDARLVRKLAKLLDDTGLTEIEFRASEKSIRVARQMTAPAMTLPAAPVESPALNPAPTTHALVPEDHPGAITSPMVGTAYLSPEPGADPFVRVGDEVSEGQVVILVEAMKTFNEVRAPRAGRISHIFVENGTPVEFNQALMILE